MFFVLSRKCDSLFCGDVVEGLVIEEDNDDKLVEARGLREVVVLV
jgi:hypothetical protein